MPDSLCLHGTVLDSLHKWLPGQVISLTHRQRRFVDNPRMNVWRYYQPIARQLLTNFCSQRLTLLIDCTALGFDYRLMVIAIAYRRRALPLIWSVHRSKRGMVPSEAQIAPLRGPTQRIACAGALPLASGMSIGPWDCTPIQQPPWKSA